MPPVSRFKLNDQVLNKLSSLFFEVVGNIHNKDEFHEIIKDVLSSTERVMIAKRITIIYLLLKGIDYMIICENLKVSAATVYKYRFLLEKSKGITTRFESIIRNEKIGQFLEDIYLAFRGPGVPGVDWSGAWKHKLDLERRKSEGI